MDISPSIIILAQQFQHCSDIHSLEKYTCVTADVHNICATVDVHQHIKMKA